MAASGGTDLEVALDSGPKVRELIVGLLLASGALAFFFFSGQPLASSAFLGVCLQYVIFISLVAGAPCETCFVAGGVNRSTGLYLSFSSF